MHKKVKNRFVISCAILGVVLAMPILGDRYVADATNGIEDEFISVIDDYSDKNVVVENGMYLEIGETLDLSEYPDWNLSNKNTVKIDKDGIVKPINEGTVFLSQEFDGDLHVIEIYVPQKQKSTLASKQKKETKRNYYKVFLDPGHGGSDPGAGGNGIVEAKLNLEIANQVKAKLEAKGIDVKMSRTTDNFISLSERPKLANEYGADVFVSIHHNSATATANGIETFYHSNKSSEKPLSTELQTNMIKQTGAKDRGVKNNTFVVLSSGYMPSSLVEGGFMTNAQEASKLKDPAYKDKLSTGIANGIEDYLEKNINIGLEEIPPTAQVAKTGTVINTDSLNVRSGYGTGYSVIGTLSNGEKVDIYDTNSDGWHKINFDGSYGYISGKYVNIDATEPEKPEPEKPEPEPEKPDTEKPEPEKPSIKFVDIDNHWAKPQILEFVEKGYINGYEINGKHEFRPENPITRAEFVKLINRTFGFTEKTTPAFGDVDKKEWYYDEISIGVKAGYIDGYEIDGKYEFRPDAPIKRQEAAKIVAKITGLKGDGILDFKDADKIEDWAKEYVDALNDNKIMEGNPNGEFKPLDNITRGESVATLSRTIK